MCVTQPAVGKPRATDVQRRARRQRVRRGRWTVSSDLCMPWQPRRGGSWGDKIGGQNRKRGVSAPLHPIPTACFKWSGREDLNLRPPEPHSGALPGCATPREMLFDAAPRLVAARRIIPEWRGDENRRQSIQRFSTASTSSNSLQTCRISCLTCVASSLAVSPESRCRAPPMV